MNTNLKILVPGITLALALAGCGGSGSAGSNTPTQAAAAATVRIIPDPATIGAFTPPAVSVKAGETVKWQFEDLNPHTVSSATFSSQPMAKGKEYTHTFAKAGTYEYHCAIHPEMLGTVTVS